MTFDNDKNDNEVSKKHLCKYKIIYKPVNERPLSFYCDSYEIVDSGHTIKFFSHNHQELRMLPYVLTETKVILENNTTNMTMKETENNDRIR